jgi:hypothetical protein
MRSFATSASADATTAGRRPRQCHRWGVARRSDQSRPLASGYCNLTPAGPRLRCAVALTAMLPASALHACEHQKMQAGEAGPAQ